MNPTIESKLYDRASYDTNASWVAFQDYRAMGGLRSLRQLLEQYVQQASNGNPTPTKKWNTLANWSERHNWVARCKAWDAEQDQARQMEERDRLRSEHQEKIETFRRSHEAIGKSSYQLVVSATAHLKKYLDNPQTLTTSDAIGLMRAIATLGAYASDQWAKAIGVDRLLEKLDEGDSEARG